MRYSIIYSFLLFIPCLLIGQQITFNTEPIDSSQQKFVNAYSCYFKTYEDVYRLWKIGLGNASDTQTGDANNTAPFRFNARKITFGMEQRIGTGWSIGFQWRYGGNNHIDRFPIEERTNILSLELVPEQVALETRWYFNKARQVREGLSGNNLSGFYLGLNNALEVTDISVDEFQEDDILPKSIGNITNVAFQSFLSLGWQQLVRERKSDAYVNIQLGSGFTRNAVDLKNLYFDNDNQIQLANNSKWKWFLDYQISIGSTLWTKRKEYVPEDCTILQYYEEEKDLWKIDFFNIIDRFSDEGLNGKVSLEYERKLGSSSFSINPLVELHYHVPFQDTPAQQYLSYGTELRYYYNLKKLMRKGLTGNNLSANYVGSHVYYTPDRFDRPSIGVQWGIQRQLFKSVYYDAKFLFDVQTPDGIYNDFLNRLGIIYKVGFAF